MKRLEILKNKLIQKVQRYFISELKVKYVMSLNWTHLSMPPLFLLFTILFSSCQTQIERTAPTSSDKWIPPFYFKIDTLPKQNFSDEILTAKDLIDIALCNNPKTRITWEQAKKSSYQLQEAKSTLYPQIASEIGYGITYQRFNGDSSCDGSGIVVDQNTILQEDAPNLIDPVNAPGISFGQFLETDTPFNHLILSDISATYLLFDFGGRCQTIESARQALQKANWTHNRTIQNVIVNVLVAYYSYLDAKAMLEAQKDDLKDAEKNLDAAKELFQAGVKTQLDVLQTQSQLINTQLNIEKTEGILKMELGNLANALGVPANTPLKVQDLPKDLPLDKSVQDVDNLLEIAKKCRPDLTATWAEYKKRKADLAVANSDGNPYITANAEIERADAIGHTASSGTVYSAAIALEVPIFQGCYFINRRRSAKARMNEALAQIQKKESDVLQEVWNSYYAFKTAVKTYEYSEEFLKYTEKTYEAAMGGYKEGTGTILDLLAAQKALSLARAQIIQARTQWVTSLTGIAYATGTL